ncbi:MAG: hypothetical protein FK734_01650 [Asgard group archaeon]|nr:hypothetical protein [Asgard group archaeon]
MLTINYLITNKDVLDIPSYLNQRETEIPLICAANDTIANASKHLLSMFGLSSHEFYDVIYGNKNINNDNMKFSDYISKFGNTLKLTISHKKSVIHIVSALGGCTIDLSFNPTTTVNDIIRKTAIMKRQPENSVILIYRGEQLDRNETLSNYNIKTDDNLYLIARTEGGGPPTSIGVKLDDKGESYEYNQDTEYEYNVLLIEKNRMNIGIQLKCPFCNEYIVHTYYKEVNIIDKAETWYCPNCKKETWVNINALYFDEQYEKGHCIDIKAIGRCKKGHRQITNISKNFQYKERLRFESKPCECGEKEGWFLKYIIEVKDFNPALESNWDGVSEIITTEDGKDRLADKLWQEQLGQMKDKEQINASQKSYDVSTHSYDVICGTEELEVLARSIGSLFSSFLNLQPTIDLLKQSGGRLTFLQQQFRNHDGKITSHLHLSHHQEKQLGRMILTFTKENEGFYGWTNKIERFERELGKELNLFSSLIAVHPYTCLCCGAKLEKPGNQFCQYCGTEHYVPSQQLD